MKTVNNLLSAHSSMRRGSLSSILICQGAFQGMCALATGFLTVATATSHSISPKTIRGNFSRFQSIELLLPINLDPLVRQKLNAKLVHRLAEVVVSRWRWRGADNPGIRRKSDLDIGKLSTVFGAAADSGGKGRMLRPDEVSCTVMNCRVIS